MLRGRRKFKKIFLTAVIGLAIIVAGGGCAVYFIMRASLPLFEGTVTVEGLSEPVTIKRDEQSRPHIYAENKEDLFFGQGYAQAQDRLWQMELHRRAGQGRISELVGAGELDFDLLLRRAGLDRLAQTLREKSSPETLKYLSAYASGINAYLEEAGTLPPEFYLLRFRPERWTADDVFSVISVIVFSTSGNYENELLRLSLETELSEELFMDMVPTDYPETGVPPVWSDYSFSASAENFPARTFAGTVEKLSLKNSRYYPRLNLGCNAWAISPHLSASGQALFAFDSHSSIEVPNQFYENRLIAEGETEVYGWSVPGMPGILYGFNEYLAWGMTSTGDTQDLFLEERHPDDPHLFLYDGEWYEAEVYTTEIKVSGREEPEVVEIIKTRHGPLITEDPPVSLRWSAHYSEEGFDALLEMNFARGWDEFRDALKRFTMPSTHITYADVEGNIASRTAGLLPVRRTGSGALASPGWDPDYGWEGFIPMDELPELFNPPQGYVAAANAVTALEDYPDIISTDNAPGYRMIRIIQMLQGKSSFTLQDMKEMQTDRYNAHAENRLPCILEVAEKNREELNPTEESALEVLIEWGEYPLNSPDKAGPAIFEGWYLHLVEEIFRAELGDELFKELTGSPYLVYENVERFLERRESPWFRDDREGIILEAFRAAVARKGKEMGDEPAAWRWDGMQSISFDHIIGREVEALRPLFGRGPYSFGGGPMTVNRAGYRLNKPYEVSHISSLRLIAEMSSEMTAFGSMPMGQSGHLLSPHFDDQLKLWLAGDYYPLYFREAPAGAETLILKPQ